MKLPTLHPFSGNHKQKGLEAGSNLQKLSLLTENKQTNRPQKTDANLFFFRFRVCVRPYILYADGEISLEVVEVLRQLIAMVIVGKQALEKCQKLRKRKKNYVM